MRLCRSISDLLRCAFLVVPVLASSCTPPWNEALQEENTNLVNLPPLPERSFDPTSACARLQQQLESLSSAYGHLASHCDVVTCQASPNSESPFPTNWSDQSFDSCDLRGYDLGCLQFNRSRFSKAIFGKINPDNDELSDEKKPAAKVKHAGFAGATFENSFLDGVDFSDSNLQHEEVFDLELNRSYHPLSFADASLYRAKLYHLHALSSFQAPAIFTNDQPKQSRPNRSHASRGQPAQSQIDEHSPARC